MINEIKHYKGIKVKVLSATDHKGLRIKLIDEWFNQSKIINYEHTGGDTLYQALDYLTKNGFKVVGYSEMNNEYIVFCDNWGDNCIKLNDLRDK